MRPSKGWWQVAPHHFYDGRLSQLLEWWEGDPRVSLVPHSSCFHTCHRRWSRALLRELQEGWCSWEKFKILNFEMRQVFLLKGVCDNSLHIECITLLYIVTYFTFLLCWFVDSYCFFWSSGRCSGIAAGFSALRWRQRACVQPSLLRFLSWQLPISLSSLFNI